MLFCMWKAKERKKEYNFDINEKKFVLALPSIPYSLPN